MTIYTCDESFEGMMTCIYDAWASGLGHRNIRLELEPVLQSELFCDYVHVDADKEKTEKVVRSVRRKISDLAYRQIYLAAMSFEPDRLDAIYRFMLLGFAYGSKVTEMLGAPPVVRVLELSRKTGNEAHYFREFSRFSSVDRRIYVSHIEPKCNILAITSIHFADRMPSEHWMIIDDNRLIASVHPKDEPFYLTRLTSDELASLAETERRRDEFTELWQEFFRSIGIEKRRNYVCQRTMLPLWYRKHMTEFQES